MSKEYTTTEAAQIVGVSPGRIRQLVANKEIDHRKFGSVTVITELGIEQLQARKTKPGPAKNERRTAA
jgi:excisionase family DNA binding protein